jgi:hypothetical protein
MQTAVFVTATTVASLFIACASDEKRQPPPQAPGPYGPAPSYGSPYGSPPAYGPPQPAAQPYGTPSGPAYGPSSNGAQAPSFVGPDPIAAADMRWLRGRSTSLMQELVAVLPDDAKRRVQSVPLVVDDTPGEVNAFAACVKGGPILSVSDGLLDIAAHLSAARANDDVFHTQKVNDYIAFLARYQKPHQPIPEPPSGFFDPRQASDPARVQREQAVLDEVLGFVIGHELGHHRLGHLPCTGAPGPFGLGEVARDLSGSVPIFNQPNELAADAAGTNNLLIMGARRSGYHLTEAGGLLIMQFFASVDQMSPEDILFSFDRTHPPPQVRVPVIQQTANFYRISGGWLPIPGF